MVHVDAVVEEAPVVRVAAIVLGRTPEASTVAGVVETAIDVAAARGHNRKAIGIFSVATVVPAAGRFQFCSRGTGSTYSGPQCIPLGIVGQMPTLGAHSTNGATG